MNLQTLKLTVEQWLFSPESRYHGPERIAHRCSRIIYAVGRDLVNGQLTLHAMSLVYTTLLSMVPLLALSFSVLKTLGGHNELTPLLENAFSPFGEQGPEIVANILGFVDRIKVGVLGSVGLALLVYTVISLVQKIERSFNFIWRVPQLRSIGQRFSNYLSVIVIGPLLVASAIGATASIMSSSIVQALVAIEPFGSMILLLIKFAPFFFMIGAFTFIYIFMPNTSVDFRSALIGGIAGGMAWQTCGLLFASFVVSSSDYQAIYSGFALGIILLIWIYLNWMILLLGAAISYYVQNSEKICKASKVHSSPRLDERIGLAVMFRVAKRFDRGETSYKISELERQLSAPPQITRRVTDNLVNSGMLAISGDRSDRYVPGCSIDHIPMSKLLKVIRHDDQQVAAHMPLLDCDELISTLESVVDDKLQELTLADLVRRDEKAG
ncbi:YihY/virulence factor BrkB family protein [Oleiphilus messinensis]|uniref:YihY/virulence factor BrkB family protein n=1 Tax=Oleiphilus messinensis TaxID=141451 RepID=UPI0018DF8898|nr:YihY/virulence factor BrkB family protein [Oleiphilus messinensis]